MASKDGLTLGDLYRGLREQLAAANVSEPEVSARRIAAEASGTSAAEVALAPQTPMTVRMVAHADAMAARRVAGEPLQYVLGSWAFRELDLAIDRRALIPRPETEVVAGIAIDWLNGTARHRHPAELSVADLGTGCGAIALSIAHEVPQARVFATDNSTEALALAAANLAGLGNAATRVSLHHGSWLDALASVQLSTPLASRETRAVSEGEGTTVEQNIAAAVTGLHGRLDVIVANPPYVADGDALPAEVRDWEPHEALYAGPDGLGALRTIVREARGWLAPGGLLVLEIGAEQGTAAVALAEARGYADVRIEPDLAGRDRVLVATRPRSEPGSVAIGQAIERLREGHFVVAPTDTLCGIMARYADADAVARVCEAKDRPRSEPMPILVSGISQADELVEFSPRARVLAERHWPGGLTLVAKRRGGPDPLHGRETLGVRAPAVGWLRWLIDETGPVTGTSANRHGVETPARADDAAASLAVPPVADAVIAGTAPGGVASTVVDVTGDQPVVLREGAIAAGSLGFSDFPAESGT